MQGPIRSVPREDSKLITCVLPDDGSHKALLEALRQERGISRAEVILSLAMGESAGANANPGTVPGTYMARLVRVVVPAAEADALFEFICDKARINREGGGVVLQNALGTSTTFTLPEGVSEEQT